MLPDYEEFKRRADALRATIAKACALALRNENAVEILAVTKSQPAEAAEYAARYGLRAVGENRVQEGIDKRALTSAAVAWELIGHLQSNKARLAVQHFNRIQTVDSERLLEILDRVAAEAGRTLPILLQVNVARDPAKSGVEPDEAPRLLSSALALKNIRVEGLMTVAPLSADSLVARRAFEALRTLRDRLAADSGTKLAELSMGMSGTVDEAIAEGSTMVRVGAALFGSRG
jgi:PLP dependent protein